MLRRLADLARQPMIRLAAFLFALWDPTTAQERPTPPNRERVNVIKFLADGRWLVIKDWEKKSLEVWDTVSRTSQAIVFGTAHAWCVGSLMA